MTAHLVSKCRECNSDVTVNITKSGFICSCTSPNCFFHRSGFVNAENLYDIPSWVVLTPELAKMVAVNKEKLMKSEVRADDVSGVASLGSGKTDYPNQTGINPCLLERFPNKFRGNAYTVTFHTKEFTSLCPKTSQPDFGEITIEYAPDEWCIESKGLKLYTFSYRNAGMFMETITNNFLTHLVELVKPRWMKVTGNFAPRGGIGLVCTAEYAAGKGTLLESYATERGSI